MSTVNWDEFFNDVAKRRILAETRKMAELIVRDDVINMCGGVPNPLMFPIETATLQLRDGTVLKMQPHEMERAQQYAGSLGFPELIEIVLKIIYKHHNPPLRDQRDICFTCGSQDALSKSLEMLISTGDTVIVPESVYEGALIILSPYKPHYLAIEEDEDGLKPESLHKLLSTWKAKDSRAPKVMYAVPTGCNPTGTITTLERKKKIYQLAQEYNFLIIEDEPYFLLNYEEEPTPSFLSLDTDGRVIHLESFSKIIAAGFRVGYVYATKEFITRVNAYVQSSSQQAASLSQSVVIKLLQFWGEDGFNQHVSKVRNFYKSQRDTAIASARKWLTGLAEWTEPKGGLFLWLKVLRIHDTDNLAQKALLQGGVGVLAGKYFLPGSKDSPYIRIAFSCCSPEAIDEGFKKLAVFIRHETNVENEID